MKTYFYDLSGGINQAATKTELGLNTNKLFWSDSHNMEVHQGKGVIRQKGNIKLSQITPSEKIISMHEIKYEKNYALILVTQSGKIYIYTPNNQNLKLLDKKVNGTTRLNFVNYLNGVVISSKNDSPFFIKNNATFDVVECNLKNAAQSLVKTEVIAVYKGRVWAAEDSCIYFSALGKYNDFTTADDAGYIKNFHTDTDDIIALKPYKDYLAIYKKNKVYLLTGSTPADFAIVPFADKGLDSFSAVVTVNNKQYFLTDGVYSLEQSGQLNQIQLGNEITQNIKPEFSNFDKMKFDQTIAIHYERKNQIWYFIPYSDDEHFHTIWINDYINKCWFKRIVPQDITTACIFNDDIITADKDGRIYKEDFGNTFNGIPIDFMWKSPFLAVGDSNQRKTIDEFYFVLDESHDNDFNFSTYKDFDSEYKDDTESVLSENYENLNWDSGKVESTQNFYWDSETTPSNWALSSNARHKAEISGSNYSLQLCIEGKSIENNAAIIGLEFKEIYPDE